MLQIYGFCCVWTTLCLYRLEYSVNDLLHPGTSQEYGRSPDAWKRRNVSGEISIFTKEMSEGAL